MKRTLFSLALLLGVVGAGAAAEFKTVTVDELVALQKDGKVVVYDVNPSGVRTNDGIIPGAKLLSGCCNFDPAAELPSDKAGPLVFYCANTH